MVRDIYRYISEVRDIYRYIPAVRDIIDISLTTGLYEIYTLGDPYNLRCQSGIYVVVNLAL